MTCLYIRSSYVKRNFGPHPSTHLCPLGGDVAPVETIGSNVYWFRSERLLIGARIRRVTDRPREAALPFWKPLNSGKSFPSGSVQRAEEKPGCYFLRQDCRLEVSVLHCFIGVWPVLHEMFVSLKSARC